MALRYLIRIGESMNARSFDLFGVVLIAVIGAASAQSEENGTMVRYARFEQNGSVSYGMVEDGKIRPIEGDLLGTWSPTEKLVPLSGVKLLAPVKPNKVFAVGLNYRSHLGDRAMPQVPEIFIKLPTCIIGPEDTIVLPNDTEDVHYEGELVVVIGKRGRNIPKEKAAEYILGVTCGNDVSARQWQKNDLQWWRAKGSDTFGPCGPFLVMGLNYDDLQLELRHNGVSKQKQRTSDLIFTVADIVAWISRRATLEPGDLIFTGTPGKTTALSEGDTVEVEIEQIGVLRNKVRREN